MTDAPSDELPNAERQAPTGRTPSVWITADALIIGGLTVVWGSFSTWGACDKEPCEGAGGLLHIFERSGVDVGLGVVTAILGLLLAGLGIYALLNPRVCRPRLAVLAAASVLAAICIHLVRVYVIDDYDGFYWPPYFGLYVTALGGLIALAGGAWQWQVVRRAGRRSPSAASRVS
jgi:hypothetical protein